MLSLKKVSCTSIYSLVFGIAYGECWLDLQCFEKLCKDSFSFGGMLGETKCLNSELWHACAGPLVSLPQIGSRVVYFPQGHSEQVAASTNKEVDSTIPNYPGLQPQLICQLHNVTMHADVETDEVYAQMTLQPLSPVLYLDCFDDTSTHGGFSVPRRAAEKVFPPLDYSQTPPAQELMAKDLHGNEWKFRHIFRGLRDGDMNLNSPLAWLRGGIGDQGVQSLNFQRFGVSPWMQPRLDTSMLGLQPDIYHVMAAAALQETGSLDPSKLSNQPLLQFQQNAPNLSASLIQNQNQMLQTPHNQQNFLQNFPKNSVISQAQILQQQLQLRQQLNDQQQQLHEQRQQQQVEQQVQQSQQLHPHFQDQQTNKTIPTVSQIGPASVSQFTPLQGFSSTNQLLNFSDLVGNHMTSANNSSMSSVLSSFSHDGTTNLMNLHGPNPIVSHSSSSKRVALDPQLPSKVSQFGVPHQEELVIPSSKVTDLPALLPPFPGRDFPDFQGVNDSHNNLLYGVNNDSSAIMPSGCQPLETVATRMDHYQCHLQPLHLQVHKSGSFGRSLDISKFSSYNELRSELAHMFGLEGLLEDPQRSGWQLVFVDRENDVLLLGDDPWQEFVNSVWYIKILSPLEVQQMGKEGLDPNSVQSHYLSSNGNSCDEFMSRNDPRTSLNGIPSVGTLDY
ncbi:UNVERIFIED_CONTAM: Auxin response factor 6 [Sesamum radiatum]|uniref:Auxin-responsive protein n=1 Tax=Sesamum radiatum TaxID=300843 RepID=A0AAW2K6L2_SESRA